MRAFLVLMALAFFAPSTAAAHSLRVFATVEGAEIVGYGFFVGGGRPRNAEWSASMAGKAVARGRTDDDGAFAFAAPDPVSGPVTVTINSGEGHVASRALAVERFGGVISPDATAARPDLVSAAPKTGEGGQVTADVVRAAVAEEITPLLERIEQMDARLRLTDIVAGISLIFGMAGIALWARGRRP